MNPSDNKQPIESARLIPRHGGYRQLRSFKAALAAYDGTVIFCDRFIDRRSRTHDQMVQAARSGVRNIEEASVASATSKKTELKLTNVARASLEELLRDYEDYLRHQGLALWDKNSPQAKSIRFHYQSEPSDQSDSSDASDPFHLRSATAEVCANTLLCLINQASYLLRRQLERLEQDFLENGGFTERLYAARTQARQSPPPVSAPSEKPAPLCPLCSEPMRLRTARTGSRAGTQFYGCSKFPECKGTRPVDPPER